VYVELKLIGVKIVSEFFLPMIPPTITDQRKRMGVTKSGKPFTYKQQELLEARSKLSAHIGQYAPEEKMQGAIRLTTKWLFPITGKHGHGEYKTSRPDTDNLQKMLKDVMTELHFWVDDAQVASEITEKFYSNQPGIYIKIEEV